MDRSDVNVLLAELVGQRVWGARLGHGTMATLELGRPKPHTDSEQVHGEWHLWLYLCAWHVASREGLLVGSNDYPLSETGARLGQLDDQHVTQAHVDDDGVLRVGLDGGYRLVAFPAVSDDSEHWLLFLPSGDVITAGPNLRYARTPAAPPSEASGGPSQDAPAGRRISR